MFGLQASNSAVWMIALLVLGACGLFLAMPGGRAGAGRVGFVLLAAAAGILIGLVTRLAAPNATIGWYAGCGLVALFAGVRVITHARPVYSALYFVLLVVAVTGLLLLMQATFLAAALVIIYAGAILVTYVFVIMLAQQTRPPLYDTKPREPFFGCLAGFLLLTVVGTQLFAGAGTTAVSLSASAVGAAGAIEPVGTRLLTEYVIAIQMIGLLLLVAMVGAIAIARRQAPTTTEGEMGC